MKALLLAAGYGTRLRPLTNHIPKCLVPVQQKPLLQYWLDLFEKSPIHAIMINTHYLSETVHRFIASSHLKDRITLAHETELLGTGGTILKNKTFFQDGPFLVAHADNLTRFSLYDFIQTHQERKPGVEITMMTFDTDTPQSCGIVALDQNNVVIGFHEKSQEYHGTRANAAVYIMEPSVIDFMDSLKKEIVDISTEVLPYYMGRMQTFHNADYHRDIGNQESLALAEVEYT